MGDVTALLPAVPFPAPDFWALHPAPSCSVRERALASVGVGRAGGIPDPFRKSKAGERAGERRKRKDPGALSHAGPSWGRGLQRLKHPHLLRESSRKASQNLPGPPGRRLRAPTLLPAQRFVIANVCGLFNISYPPPPQLSALVSCSVSSSGPHSPLPTLYPRGLQCLSLACIKAGTSEEKEWIHGRKTNPLIH